MPDPRYVNVMVVLTLIAFADVPATWLGLGNQPNRPTLPVSVGAPVMSNDRNSHRIAVAIFAIILAAAVMVEPQPSEVRGRGQQGASECAACA